MTADSDIQPDPSAPAARDTVSGILRALAEEGYGHQFVPGRDPGTLRCLVCGSTSAVERMTVHDERRLEGASDPDDMVLVEALSCPVCAAGGTIVLGYGPEASADDAALVAGLQRPSI